MPRALEESSIGELIGRIQRLTPDTARMWGSMTAHEMLCHLGDSFRAMMGERGVSMVPSSPLQRRLIRFIALHLPLRFPKDIATRPEVDPKRSGTRPAGFESDRQAVIVLMRRFLSPDARYQAHPMFGVMPRRDWMIWAYRHVDHHLRQFGV